MVKKILNSLCMLLQFTFLSPASGSNTAETYHPSLFASYNNQSSLDNYKPNDKIMKPILSSFNRSEVGSKKLMVISDMHIMSEKLLKKDGTAFQNYLQKDRKLLQESRAIAESLVESILKEQPDLVLVCGDMTKDGELLSHQKFVETFNPVIQNGIKMLVIPGNHDINNPDAVYFNGDRTEPAKSVSPEEFRKIYNDFGFGNALDSDTNSLSYVSEPVDGLWVIAIDGCRYYENQFVCQGDKKNHCVTEGKIKPETMRWIKQQADLARKNGKQIIVMIHHNVVEHFDFQGEISAPYLLENFKQVQSDFMQTGIQVIFTGHFHANDIAKTHDVNGNYLFDVETGSPVTYPCPYRVIEFKNNQLFISTRFIEKIDYDLKGVEFQTYAKKLIKDNIPSVLSSLIKEFYPEIKQAANPYLPFIKLPKAQKLGQLVEDNLGEIAVNVMLKIYEGNNDDEYGNIILKKLDKSIENIAGELARTRLLKRQLIKSFNKIDYVKKIKIACHSIFYNVKKPNQQLTLSFKPENLFVEKNDKLNYPIILQMPQSAVSHTNSFVINDQKEW